MDVFCLNSENLTNLGGPMGSEYTYSNWKRYFDDVDKAKKAAEEDYGDDRDPIKWKDKKDGKSTSGDLGFVMYDITKIFVES